MCFVGLSVCFSVSMLGHAQFHGCPSPASSLCFANRMECRRCPQFQANRPVIKQQSRWHFWVIMHSHLCLPIWYFGSLLFLQILNLGKFSYFVLAKVKICAFWQHITILTYLTTKQPCNHICWCTVSYHLVTLTFNLFWPYVVLSSVQIIAMSLFNPLGLLGRLLPPSHRLAQNIYQVQEK